MNKITIICFGDSITDSGRLFDYPPLGNGYVSILSDKLKLAHPELSFSIINKGIDGFTVSRVLEQAQQESRIYSADYITLLIGINDIGLMMNTDRTPKQIEKMFVSFFENYRALLSHLTNTNATVILMEPFIFSYPAEYQTWFPYVKKMSDMIRKLADAFHVPYIYLHESFLALSDALGISNVTTDGIHLTESGHQHLTDQILELINIQKESI